MRKLLISAELLEIYFMNNIKNYIKISINFFKKNIFISIIMEPNNQNKYNESKIFNYNNKEYKNRKTAIPANLGNNQRNILLTNINNNQLLNFNNIGENSSVSSNNEELETVQRKKQRIMLRNNGENINSNILYHDIVIGSNLKNKNMNKYTKNGIIQSNILESILSVFKITNLEQIEKLRYIIRLIINDYYLNNDKKLLKNRCDKIIRLIKNKPN